MHARPTIPPGPYLIVGLARSGIAAARALRARGERVLGIDSRSPAAAVGLHEIGVDVRLHESDGSALLETARAVVKSPGVPAGAGVIEAARARGVPVLGELELAWRLLPNEFIAVTGTNGKTTTVELIGQIHREAGLPVAVAGNVGTAVSSLVGTLEQRVTVVCEVSSFQLEDTLAFAPEAAVLLNVTPDHLDRHGTLAAYLSAKLEVFARQREGDLAVLPSDLAERLERAGSSPQSLAGIDAAIHDDVRRVTFGAGASAELSERDGELSWRGRPLLALTELRLPGRHNVENAMAAAAVCLARGIDAEAVRAGLRSFAGVAHRLEQVAALDGVLYVNDSKATNLASTRVALEAFAGRPVHLILGGQGKGQDFASLREAVARGCAAIYLIGEDSAAIASALAAAGPRVSECVELEAALSAARAAAGREAPGADASCAPAPVVLLSPACASFDQFADFEARGNAFRELVREMEA
jgi:UDP-N-acetylmuramoylalanine--D-glutamate ligase